jgi:hypothetical protein
MSPGLSEKERPNRANRCYSDLDGRKGEASQRAAFNIVIRP